MRLLDPSEITEELKSLPGWKMDGNVLTAQFHFYSFSDLVAFVVKISFLAQAADHHPDMQIQYRTLTVNLSTHEVKHITDRDINMARAIQAASYTGSTQSPSPAR